LTWQQANDRRAAGAAAGLSRGGVEICVLFVDSSAVCLSDARMIREAGRPSFRINVEESEDRDLDGRA